MSMISISPPVSLASNVAEIENWLGTLKIRSSGMPLRSASTGSKRKQVWS
jgi:hypothetical protein